MALVERYHSSQELKGSISHESSKADLREDGASKSHPGNKQGISLVHSEERAKHVGILALEAYVPNTYVGPLHHTSDYKRWEVAPAVNVCPQCTGVSGGS